MAVPLESVVKQLADSGIIAPGKLENFVPPKADPKDGETLLRELYKQNLLTKFQAQQIAAGKANSLILGNYLLIDRIGAGGMGQVFKAQHRRMDRLVAIKMLPPAVMKDAATIARFEREVKAAAKLRHPNIVAADDADEARGVHFLVMEYVDGQDLSALVKKDGPLPVGKAVNYILQAARGLEFAHGEGVIHRDIKPANLLLDKKGVVKILDMGLARIDSDGPAQTELTGSGTIMGTVDYMSPEQALNTKHADHRADIYSLGISLYFLLAGKAAYGGESAMEKLMAHSTQPIPPLQDVQTTVPKQLDTVFKRMVAKKMEDRFQSMGEVIEALEDLGIGASATVKKSEVASTLALSPEQKKKLASQAKKKPLSSLTDSVASEKTKHLLLKIIGGSFATIIAPILVAFLIRYVETKDELAKPPAATAPASVPVVEASNTASQPTVPVASGGGQTPLSVPSTAVASSVPAIGTAPPHAKAPFDVAQAKAHQAAWAKHLGTTVESKNSVGMSLVLIPPGEFLMGSTDEQVEAALKVAEELKAAQGDKDRIQKNEKPQHRVVITKPFFMGATEVTVGQFRQFIESSKYVTGAEQYGFGNSEATKLNDNVKEGKGMNWKSPGYVVTDDYPVSEITWNDACAYCAWLSEQEQRTPWYRPDGQGGWLVAAQASGYRLPTEAEWEYAYRAGTTTQFSFGDDKLLFGQYGWYIKNAGNKAQPVALKLPNPFGLFDMHGNVYEWCQDFYDKKWYEKSSPVDPLGPSSGSVRVFRGGNWSYHELVGRSAYRSNGGPSNRNNRNGFRIVRPLDPTADSRLTTGTATTQANQRWNTPAFQAWVKEVQAMPAEEQVKAVSKKLTELNPGFDGKIAGRGSWTSSGAPKVENGFVTEIGLPANNLIDMSPVRALVGLKGLRLSPLSGGNPSALSDLSPLKGMSLTELGCRHLAKVVDLSPLHGMPLTFLDIYGTQVSDLSPLRGMPLTNLDCYGAPISDLSPLQETRVTVLTCGGSKISDLSPLKGMPLTKLACDNTPVSDLSPLKGLPLEGLSCPGSQVSDLSPLQDCKRLTTLNVTRTKVTPASVAALQKALPDCKIEWDGPAK